MGLLSSFWNRKKIDFKDVTYESSTPAGLPERVVGIAGNVVLIDATTGDPITSLGGGGGGAGSVAAFSSPTDFTAANNDTGSITLSGLPFSITDASQFGYVKAVNTSTNVTVTYTTDDYSFGYSAGVLTIYEDGTKITALTANDVYEIGVTAQEKSYDASLDVDKIIEQSPLWSRYTDVENLATAQGITNSYADVGSEIDCRGYKTVGIYCNLTAGTSTNSTVKVLSKHTFGGGDEYVLETSADYIKNMGSSDIKVAYFFNVESVPYIQVQVKDDSDGTGTLTVDIVKEY